MNCPECDHISGVVDSRSTPEGEVRRRRKCGRCGLKVTTVERGADADARTKDAVMRLTAYLSAMDAADREAVLDLARHMASRADREPPVTP